MDVRNVVEDNFIDLESNISRIPISVHIAECFCCLLRPNAEDPDLGRVTFDSLEKRADFSLPVAFEIFF